MKILAYASYSFDTHGTPLSDLVNALWISVSILVLDGQGIAAYQGCVELGVFNRKRHQLSGMCLLLCVRNRELMFLV